MVEKMSKYEHMPWSLEEGRYHVPEAQRMQYDTQLPLQHHALEASKTTNLVFPKDLTWTFKVRFQEPTVIKSYAYVPRTQPSRYGYYSLQQL